MELPPFEITEEEFKNLRSIKPLPIEQPIYFKYNNDIYACQYYDGFPNRLYYSKNGKVVEAETSINHFTPMFISILKNVWNVYIPYGKFIDSVIFKYNNEWEIVYVKLSDGTKILNKFDYYEDNEFIKKCL